MHEHLCEYVCSNVLLKSTLIQTNEEVRRKEYVGRVGCAIRDGSKGRGRLSGIAVVGGGGI